MSTTLYDLLGNKPLSIGDSHLQYVAKIQMGKESCRLKTGCQQPDKGITDQPDDRSFHAINVGGTATNSGAHLTWEELWVTVPDRGSGGGLRTILDSSTGYAEPGRILAVMGPSGCGKSTLVDALAGRLSSTTRHSGNILVNGRKQRLSFGTTAYVTQEDVLLTTLTVRETVYYAALLQLPGSLTKTEKRQRADDTIREMGLQDAADTRIGGGPRSKGLSGGQRRRVSICLEILTRPSMLFLDEPTSGLDSAASFHVMKRITALARRYGQTVVVSLHQPSNEVFGLLDYLYLLTQGKTVYFGPASQASEFFAASGFACPSLMNPPDHYLKTINKNFEQEVDEESDSEGSKMTNISEAINILVSSYKSSSFKSLLERKVAEISAVKGQKLAKRSQAHFVTQCLVLTQRSMVNMFRDTGYYWLRLVIYIGIAFTLGTIFYNLDSSYPSIQERYAVITFISGFLTFMTIGGFPSFVEDLKVFGGERLNGRYGVTAYVFAHTLSSLPFLLLCSLIPGSITYYMAGMRRPLMHFLYFALLLSTLLLLVESLMMLIAGIVSNFLLGIISGAGVQGIMLLTCGFFQSPNLLPKIVWKYPFHYIAFHTYGNQGFVKNEFLGLVFKTKVGEGLITGSEIVDTYQMYKYSKWIDLAVLVGMVAVYRMLFLAVLKFKEGALPFIRAMRFSKSKHAQRVMTQPASP